MEWDFERVVHARARATEAQAEYRNACEAVAAGLIGELAALPVDRISQAAAQVRIALADAAAGPGDVQARQAWQVLALRAGTAPPAGGDRDADETEVVLRLARAPSQDDVALLEGLGLRSIRAGVVAFRGQCGLEKLAPLIARYDGHVQDASYAGLSPRSRQPRQDDGPGEADAKVAATAASSSSSAAATSVPDAAAVPASIGVEPSGPVDRFVPRAPLPTRAGERRSGGEADDHHHNGGEVR
ncbi:MULTISPECIES: hypothetical protein [unclassified Methylobacterium]|uniref:hypothetical protein n=1 Tax=unclassified Methylobacterium TaxID=2615210 RepID=UPI0011C1D1E5|nr:MULTISPECIES: hypothetical protein [unclassified Methylobacterium]MCJ2092165.1 hypothetical protein [Methylobacterium sp. J-072]MCJ2119375.1 hypothetical protein [Methylobacterium sp. J-001]QEE41704.1 hypothetical protein FVA80_24930 [Methylobacterium sp. WL1]TXN54787.1 hypothetical protein FV241_22715 [Methylobacterium sp. WL2]